MLRLFIACLALLLPALSTAATCTDGTDCYSDCRLNTDGAGNDVGSYANTGCQTKGIAKGTSANIIVSEDGEDPDYYDNVSATSNSWADSSTGGAKCFGLSGFRGCNSAWYNKYSEAEDGCSWRSGEPNASPTYGPQCAYGTCAAMADWRADNAFEAVSAHACVDIQAANEQDDEQAGLTLNSNYEGSRVVALRAPTDECGGISGKVLFSAATEMYFVAAVSFSTNITTAHADDGCACTTNSEFVPMPWKFFEYSVSNGGNYWQNLLFGGIGVGSGQAARSMPLGMFAARDTGSTEAACTSNLASAVTIGDSDCTSAFWHVEASSSQYTRSTDWPLGTWGLVRSHIKGLGTSSCEGHMWFWQEDDPSETKVIEFSGFNCATHNLQDQMTALIINNYYNGGRSECNSGGCCRTTQPLYVYYDFWEIGKGQAPPSAADVGWETALGGGGGGSTPTRGSPSGQFTIGDALKEAEAVLLAAPW